MSNNENSSPAIVAEVVEAIPGDVDQYSKPEEFCFAVELWQETPIVTICPIEYFRENGYLDDMRYNGINDLLEKNNFFEVLEAAYEFDDEKATVESVTAKMLELGFKQMPEFDLYITETNADFSLTTLAAEAIPVEDEGAADSEAITAPNELLKSLEDDVSNGER